MNNGFRTWNIEVPNPVWRHAVDMTEKAPDGVGVCHHHGCNGCPGVVSSRPPTLQVGLDHALPV
eukprot:35523-Eustigmatos_ZCMA.PRE.1